MDLISIIIPVYNVEDYLAECIESVINQTYANIEIIIVDDGSTDGSSSIISEFQKKDKRIIHLSKKNGGLSDARNYGMSIIKGKYFIFLDSDDYITLDCIESLYRSIKKNSSDIAVGNFSYLIGDKITEPKLPLFEKILTSEEAFYQMDNRKDNIGVAFTISCGKLFSSTLAHIRFPVGKKHEDEFTTFRFYAEASKIVYLHNPLYIYRIRENSITTSKYNLSRLDGIEAIENRIDYMIENLYDITLVYYKYCYLLAYNSAQLFKIKNYKLEKELQNKFNNIFWSVFRKVDSFTKVKLVIMKYFYRIIFR